MMDRAENIRKLKEEAQEPKEAKLYIIPKLSAKKKAEIEKRKELAKLDKEFYLEIWRNAPHKCYECGKHLGNKAANFMFHHLIPKSKRPDLRHNDENIAIVCITCHSKAETNLDTVPIIKKLTEEAKRKFL